VDLAQDEARSTLESAGFTVTTKQQETADKPAGTVLAQSPAPDAQLPKGSVVTITVAKQPPDVAVPDVTGQGRLAATQVLKKAGFKVTQTQQPTGDRAQDLHVISEQPAAGKAKKGSTVTITVGQYDPSLNTGASSTTPPSTTAPGSTGTVG
jgi:serine/threonine-protein kinase